MALTKKNKGVTLIAFVITILLILIIAGVSTQVGRDNITKTQDSILITELEQVKHFVGESYMNYLKTNNEGFLVGTEVEDSTAANLIKPVSIIEIPEEYYKNGLKLPLAKFYELTPVDLVKIGVEDSKNTYIVNYLTGEVINKTQQTTSSGHLLYTYSRKVFNNNDITAF